MSYSYSRNGFVNLGVATRVLRVLAAKAFAMLSAFMILDSSGAISETWYAIPVILSTYLLFTGLMGWDPVKELDKSIARDLIKQRRSLYRRPISQLS